MEILRKFLQTLSDEGIGFFVVIGVDPVSLNPDEVLRFLEDREAFESEHERKLRERDDEF